MIISGTGLGAGLILLLSLMARAWRGTRPPTVTGTLIHWASTTPNLTVDANLTALNKRVVKIGKGAHNDLVIAETDPQGGLQDEHALVLVERGENGELRFTLRPIAPIRKGYRETTSDLPLEENVTYQMGSRMFKYLRDID